MEKVGLHSVKISATTRTHEEYLLEVSGNKQINAGVAQQAGIVSSLTTPTRRGGVSGQPVAKQWHRERECEKREEERKSERKKAREKVKYLPLLSDTSYNSWAVSSRVAGCFWGLSSHRGDGWWEFLFLTFKVCHNTSQRLGNFRSLLGSMDFWENVRLVRQNDKRLSTYTQNLTLEFQYKNVCCVVLVFALERIQIREQPKAASSLGAFSCCLCYVSVAETL